MTSIYIFSCERVPAAVPGCVLLCDMNAQLNANLNIHSYDRAMFTHRDKLSDLLVFRTVDNVVLTSLHKQVEWHHNDRYCLTFS